MSEGIEPGSARAQAAQALTRCVEIFAELEVVLQAEQQALLDRDPEVLLAVAERKRSLLVDLERSASGLAELPAAEPELRARIEASFERCRQLNQINGGVVAASRGATERALALLRGDHAGPPLYDSLGGTRAAVGSRPLAQA